VTCDFDGDGKGDLAVGVPGENDGRGAVNVQYSKGGFLPTAGFLEPLHPGGEAMLRRARFGAALTCGDFTQDGVDDLAIGGPGTAEGGSVWVLWGRPGSLLSSSRYVVFHQDGATVPGSPEGSFGHALAAGDFDGDGIDDLAVGDPHEKNPATGFPHGTVLMVPGKAGALDMDGIQQVWGWPVVDDDELLAQSFGWSLAVGELVSGDADELVVGAPKTSVYPSATASHHVSFAGRVYLFRGHGGLAPYQAIDESQLGAAAGPNYVAKAPEAYTKFGWSVATGDFNGDGKIDLAVGNPSKTVGGVGAAGAVVALPGTGFGVTAAGARYLVQELAAGHSELADQYGYALAAGNWNVDGYDDLAVGAPFENLGSPEIDDAGAVYVHYGGAGLADGGGMTIQQGTGSTPGRPEKDEWFGVSLASKRLGSVDLEFLIIGIPGEAMPHPDPDCNKAGMVQLAMAWAGAGPVTDPSLLLHQDTGAPYTVADQRECSAGVWPWESYGTIIGGEFFGWATAH
jgi:hypothetical protein